MTPLVTVARGDGSRIDRPHQAVVRTSDEWAHLWAAHRGPETPAPPIDFTRDLILAVFAGQRPSTGHGVEIVSAELNGDRLDVVWRETSPASGTVTAPILCAPFHIVRCARFDGAVRWMGAGDRETIQLPAAPVPAAAAPGTNAGRAKGPRSSTGLDPRIAASLAYLVGPLSGGIILFVEQTNRDVRFHAWQSIFALGGLWLIGAFCYVLAFIAIFVSSAGLPILMGLATLVWVLWAVVWAWCLWKAYAGGTWQLPVVGAWALRAATIPPAA